MCNKALSLFPAPNIIFTVEIPAHSILKPELPLLTKLASKTPLKPVVASPKSIVPKFKFAALFSTTLLLIEQEGNNSI
ncbi:hypothetical protein J476_4056 [Acinetobacter baumannii 532413]|nr:hypothetical protein J476_4056 [Acinetobacter baumannii 532413]